MTSIWKREILLSEAAHQKKHIDERRSFNRFLEGGSNPHFEMLREVARLEGGMRGGGFTDYLKKGFRKGIDTALSINIPYLAFKGASKAASYISDKMTNTTLYQASVSMEAWKKLTETEIPGFCRLLDKCLRNGDDFPRDTWDVLSASLVRACGNKDITAALANRKETQSLMNIFKGDAKKESSKLGFFRRVWNWIRNNKMKIFSITTILFIAYLTFCYFTAGIGCALAGKIFMAGNTVKAYLGVNTVAQAAVKQGSVIITGTVPAGVSKHGFFILSEKAAGAIGKRVLQKYATKTFTGSIVLGGGAKNNIFYELVGTYAADKKLKYVSVWLLYMQKLHPAKTFCDMDYKEMSIDTQLWLKDSKDYARKLQTKSLSDATTKVQRRAILEERMRPSSPRGSPKRGSPKRGSPKRGSPKRGSRSPAKRARETRRAIRKQQRAKRRKSLAEATSREEKRKILEERMGMGAFQNVERFRAQHGIN